MYTYLEKEHGLAKNIGDYMGNILDCHVTLPNWIGYEKKCLGLGEVQTRS